MDEQGQEPGSEQSWESPLDELFVEGARFREPSARERAAEAREFRKRGKAAARRNRRARRRGRRARMFNRAVPFVLIGALVLSFWYVQRGSGDDESQMAAFDLPEQVQVVYATPTDVAVDPDLPAAIAHEMHVADDWLASQADGKHLKFVEADGEIVVEETSLLISASELRERVDAHGLVRDEFSANGRLEGDELFVVFVPVTFESLERCGEGSFDGFAVVWVGSCSLAPSVTSAWPSPTAMVVAHELMHTMGAVRECAPHYGRGGHVVDDPTDLMYDGPAVRTGEFALDPGHDDYFDHDIDDCLDVKHHPIWTG